MPSSYSRSFYSATICVYSTHTDSTILRIYRDALYGLIFWLSMRRITFTISRCSATIKVLV